MEHKIKELQNRKNEIQKKLDSFSDDIRKLDVFVRELPGSILVEPFLLSKKFSNGYLVAKKSPVAKDVYVYFFSDLVSERRLLETSVDTKIMIGPYLERYMEFLVSELEKKFGIEPKETKGNKITDELFIAEDECCPTGECQNCQDEAEARYQTAYEEWKEHGCPDK